MTGPDGRRFPIPMRGNECATSNGWRRRLARRFPIPMRGNEVRGLPDVEFELRRFPIPMRGNETPRYCLRVVRRRPRVSDPHEG